MTSLNQNLMKQISFTGISESYFIYWNWYLKFNEFGRNCAAPSFYILNSIFSSFLIEIGMKALIAFENKQVKGSHKLDCLFNQLSPEMQNNIAQLMECEMTVLKKKLEENAEHFEQWRYYYELGTNTFDITFMDKLLRVMIALLEVLNERNNSFH